MEGRAEPVGKRHRTRSDQLNLTNPTTDTLTNSNLPERCPQAKRPDAGGGLTPRPRAGEQDRRQLASAPVPVPPASARAQTAPMQAAPSNDVGNCMSMPAPPGASGARQRVASETGSKIPDLTRELLTIHKRYEFTSLLDDCLIEDPSGWKAARDGLTGTLERSLGPTSAPAAPHSGSGSLPSTRAFTSALQQAAQAGSASGPPRTRRDGDFSAIPSWDIDRLMYSYKYSLRAASDNEIERFQLGRELGKLHRRLDRRAAAVHAQTALSTGRTRRTPARRGDAPALQTLEGERITEQTHIGF